MKSLFSRNGVWLRLLFILLGLQFERPALAGTPYLGTPRTLPGQIEAEHFDEGGEGVGYHDADTTNHGGDNFRLTGVDVTSSALANGGRRVSWTGNDEWLRYTVNVQTSGYYKCIFRATSGNDGGTIYFQEIGGEGTAPISLRNTGGWETYKNATSGPVRLRSGAQVLELHIAGSTGLDIDSFEVVKIPDLANSGAYLGTAWPAPGRVETEHYDMGGEAVGFHDFDATNNGAAFGPNFRGGVDTWISTAASGGMRVGWMAEGDWMKYTVNVASNGYYQLLTRYSSGASGGHIYFQEMGGEGTGPILMSATGSYDSYQFATGNAIQLRAGTQVLRLQITDSTGMDIDYFEVVGAPSPPATGPYLGAARTVPGRIEAEHFDYGGEGVGYHDFDNLNSGAEASPNFRNTGVDITLTPFASARQKVGWTGNDEWLRYTVNVLSNGYYKFIVRGASEQGQIKINFREIGGEQIGQMVLPTTGSWETYLSRTSAPVRLRQGVQVLQLNIEISEGWDIDCFDVVGEPNPPIATPFGGTARVVPGRIEAEHFDNGGEGIAYHDTDLGNNYVQFGPNIRGTDVDIGTLPSDSGEGHLAWSATGEWLEYSVNVQTNGIYRLILRSASAAAAQAVVSLREIGGEATGPITLPNTGAIDNFQYTTSGPVRLREGPQILRLNIDLSTSCDIDYFEVIPTPPPVIVSGPQNRTVFVGRPVGFSVAATSDLLPLTYQWRKDGVDIPGATSSILAMGSARADLAGNYSVIVSDQFGLSVTSAPPAVLTVSPRQSGAVLAWGNNIFGQLNVPTVALSGVVAIATGPISHRTAVLKNDGSVMSWGLHPGNETGIPLPAQSGVIDIAAGSFHTLVLKEDGSVFAWGYDDYGKTNVPTVAQSGVVNVAAGEAHSLALKNDGSVVAWGYNNDGQTNVPVAAQSGVVAIAAGWSHTLALKQDGSVVAWGNNREGQTTVPAAAQSGVVAIAAGQDFSVALKGDGSVVPWGSDYYGETIVPLAAQSGVVAIAAGGLHVLALKSDGTLIGWGGGATLDDYDNYGQSIVPLGAQNGILAFSAGYDFSIVLTTAPVISVQPGSQTAFLNSIVRFEVSGVSPGPGPLTYQWYEDESPIIGATLNTLTLPSVQGYHSGRRYSVRLENASTFVMSDDALLSVVVPVSPVHVGTFNTTGIAYGLHVRGRYAYVADSLAGLHVIDIADPTNMTRVSGINTEGDARDVQVVGDYAYVADGAIGLVTIDVHDPTNVRTHFGDNTPGFANGVHVIAHRVYVADLSARLQVFDQFTPVSPDHLGGFSSGGDSHAVFVTGDIAYVADGTFGLTMVDVSAPTIPAKIGSYDTTGEAYDVKVAGNRAYVADRSGGLQIFSLTNPSNPSWLGAYDDTGETYSVDLLGDRAYVANFDEIQVINVADPSNPVRENGAPSLGEARKIQIVGSYAYVANGTAGLSIFSIAEPAPVVPVISVAPVSQSVISGRSAGFSVTANGVLPLRYQWRKDGIDIAGATNSFLPVGVAWAGLAGNYTVVVTDSLGTSVTSAPASLMVNPAPSGSVLAWGQTTVPVSAKSGVVAIAAGRYHTMALKNNGSVVAWGSNSYGQTTVPVSAQSGVVAIAAGAFHSVALKSAFNIVIPPASQTYLNGYNAMFEVIADGQGPFAYQWFENGVPISGATERELIVSATPANSGKKYSVRVQSGADFLLSSEATLTVLNCDSAPTGLADWWRGENVLLNEVNDTYGSMLNGANFSPGKIGRAFSFDGVDDRVSLGRYAGNVSSNNFSMAFWIYNTRSTVQTVLYKAYDVNTNYPNRFFVQTSVSGLNLYLLGSGVQGFVLLNSGFPSLSLNTWQFVAYTREGDTFRCYVNGVLRQTSTPAGLGSLDNPGELFVGGEPSGANPFAGSLDELMFFNRALSLAEIQSIYAAQPGGICRGLYPPAVARPLGSGEAQIGGPWNLSTYAEGAGPFTYKWYRNGILISGAIGSTLSVPTVSPTDAGDYYVIVSSPFGQRASEPFRLEVSLAPQIIQGPIAQDVPASFGNPLTLQVQFSGSSPFTFQWIKDGLDILGAIDSIYEVNAPNASHAGNYRVRVSNDYGSITSDPALVRIIQPLQVTTQPAGRGANIGERVEISVAVSGTGPFTYQWRLNGINIPNLNPDPATFVIPAMSVEDAGTYTVAITDPGGAINSAVAEVIMANIVADPPRDNFENNAPKILEAFGSEVRTSNTLATRQELEPEHAGKLGQRSVWFRWTAPAKGRAYLSTAGSTFDTLLGVYIGNSVGALQTVVSDDDTGPFSTSEVTFNANANQLYHIAVDGLGDASGSVLLTLKFTQEPTIAPIIQLAGQPVSLTVPPNAPAQFRVIAENATAYQWRLNGVILPGETASELTIPVATQAALGTYDVRVTGTGIDVLSQPAELQIGPNSNVRAYDKLFDGLFIIPGDPRPKAGAPIARSGFGRPPGANGVIGFRDSHQVSSSKATKEVGEPNHAGEAGGASIWFRITPVQPGWLEVNTRGSSFDTVLAVYSCEANALDFTDLTRVGSHNPNGNDHGAARVVIHTAPGLLYYCAVDGVRGARGDVVLTYEMAAPPAILEHPISRSVLVGGSITLSALAANVTSPTNYQWRLNGVPIANGNSDRANLHPIAAAQAGDYTCVVSTFAGTAVTSAARVTVLPAEPIRAQAPTFSGNRLRFRIYGGSALPLRLQSSRNLKDWTDVLVQAALDGYIDYDVPTTETNPGMFYRITQ